jgi:NAD(P)-dependent dehydrogenase (short-subunit alcohol dehydrogenase family)
MPSPSSQPNPRSNSRSNPFDLSGRVALITGGNSGIGLGFAEGLAQAGSDIAIWGTNESKNTAAVAQLRENYDVNVASFVCDVGDEAAVVATFAATVESMGRVDACFANSGVGGSAKSFLDMSADEWHRVLRVNLDGVFYTLRAAAKHMVERGEGGSLVVTASLALRRHERWRDFDDESLRG